jgi:hypothetical protein
MDDEQAAGQRSSGPRAQGMSINPPERPHDNNL